MRGLRILAEMRIVVSSAGIFHRPERDALDAFGKKTFADEPIRFRRGLLFLPLFDHRAEYVGERFVQRAGLALINKTGLVLRDAMGEFVTDDVEAFRETLEYDAVAIAVN